MDVGDLIFFIRGLGIITSTSDPGPDVLPYVPEKSWTRHSDDRHPEKGDENYIIFCDGEFFRMSHEILSKQLADKRVETVQGII